MHGFEPESEPDGEASVEVLAVWLQQEASERLVAGFGCLWSVLDALSSQGALSVNVQYCELWDIGMSGKRTSAGI